VYCKSQEDWWKSISQEQKDEYLENHPDSKFGHTNRKDNSADEALNRIFKVKKQKKKPPVKGGGALKKWKL
jgi:hypothetical protein